MEFDGEFSECRIYSAFWEGEPPGEPKLSARCEVQLLKAEKFLGSARALPSRKKQLSFWLGGSLALPRFSPTKVGAKVLRHQLRTKVRSMIYFWLR